MDEEQKYYTIILRHDESTKWMINNPILTLGEYGVEDDTHRVKRGDGQTKWSELNYESFGLEYLVTFKNLDGNIEDCTELNEALQDKISKSVFDDVQNSVITQINIQSEDDTIGRVTKLTKNINTGESTNNMLLIKSNDHSIQGYWSIDDTGLRILNLQASASIENYTPGHIYYEDQICFYNNKLYRAVTNFTAEDTFNEEQWVVLASLHSSDVKYDNKISGLEATTVKEALDELQDLDSTKLKMTKRENKIYGTNEDGEQFLYNKDDLRTVDSVNGVKPQSNKNVQIDANNINYDDLAETPKTVKQTLDEKVDKNIVGSKIVKDLTFNYNEETGAVELIEDKVDLADGSTEQEITSVNVVSDQELQNAINTVNTIIIEKETALNEKIDTNAQNINNTIEEKETTLNERIDGEVSTLNNTIETTKTEINERIDEEVNTLNETINTNKQNIETKLTDGLNTKIDKDIADSLITGIEVSVEGEEPTLKITSKTTDTKADDIKHIHIKAKGNIITSKENDQIVIDSTEIDKDIADNVERLDTIDTRLDNHDTQLIAVNQHLTNHDTQLATHENQIALHETELLEHEQKLQELNNNITDIKAVNAEQATHLTNIDGQLDTHTKQLQAQSDQIVEISGNVSSNLDKINNLTNTVNNNKTELDEDIANLEANKANKTFASATNNEVLGTLNLATIQNNEILVLDKVSVNPTTESSTNSKIKVISSDNTIVAKTITDEENNITGIDLATNLDIDVNYFLTSEILNTTIPSENTIQLSSLTATDKTEVEVQDIISDSEGTWSRVKSIDKEAGTCVTITYAKHAQAVWGTIKGNLEDQPDLNEALGTKLDWNKADNLVEWIRASDSGSDSNDLSYLNFSFDYIQTDPDLTGSTKNIFEIAKSESIKLSKGTGTNPTTYKFNVNAEGTTFDPQESGLESNLLAPAIRELKTLDDLKLEKVSTSDIIYGTDSEGQQITYNKNDFGTVDTINNITPVDKNITITGSNINISNTENASIETGFNTIRTETATLVNELKTQYKAYTQGIEFNVGSIVTQFATFSREDGVLLVAKVLTNFTTDTTQATAYESFQYDVEQGNLQLIGIPEQYTEDTTTITTDGQEVMNILNGVDGVNDTYEGLGGTEEEIGTILDEVIGNKE